MQTIHIQSYNLIDFLIEVEKNIKNGYTFDFITMENHPQMIGIVFVAGMVKQEPEEVKPIVESTTEEVETAPEASESIEEGAGSQEVTKEVVEAPKRGRKAKSE